MSDKPTKRTPDGLWSALDEAEAKAAETLQTQLSAFNQSFRLAYEAGVQVPTLRGDRHHTHDLQLAALFLKRTLNDLRAVWRLLSVGYTSQAAAVSASLWENALTSACLGGNETLAKELEESEYPGVPWSPIELSRQMATKWRDHAHQKGKPFDDDDFQIAWREVYAGYKWLCKIKHPTFPSVIHDSGATSNRSGEYTVMALPDLRTSDLPVKAGISVVSLSRALNSMEVFSHELQCDQDDPDYRDFVRRVMTSQDRAWQAYKDLAGIPLPFDLTDSQLQREYEELKARKRGDETA